MLESQYEIGVSPLIICKCFKLEDLSWTNYETIEAGISARPTDTTNTMNIPLITIFLSFIFYATGNGAFSILNSTFSLPEPTFINASYIIYGNKAAPS
jgi:hypothetical protein